MKTPSRSTILLVPFLAYIWGALRPFNMRIAGLEMMCSKQAKGRTRTTIEKHHFLTQLATGTLSYVDCCSKALAAIPRYEQSYSMNNGLSTITITLPTATAHAMPQRLKPPVRKYPKPVNSALAPAQMLRLRKQSSSSCVNVQAHVPHLIKTPGWQQLPL